MCGYYGYWSYDPLDWTQQVTKKFWVNSFGLLLTISERMKEKKAAETKAYPAATACWITSKNCDINGLEFS